MNAPVDLTISPEARRATGAWLSRDRSRATSDLDGARIDLGESEDDIVVVREYGLAGGMC